MGIAKLHSDAISSLLTNLWDGIYVVDADRVIVYWSKAAEEITGYSAEDAVGRRCGRHFVSHHTESDFLCEVGCPLAATLHDGEHREARVFLRHSNGLSVPIFVRIFPYYGDDGKIAGVIEVFRKVDGAAETAGILSELEKTAHTDRLTGASRREFGEKVLEGALQALHSRGVGFGVLLLDLDKFKPINDIHGHLAGDAVLQGVTRDIQAHLRNTDLLIRWGGDEFLVIAPHLDANSLAQFGEKLRRSVSGSTYSHNGKELAVGISAGAVLPQAGETLAALLERVDSCLYKAKEQGKNRVVLG